MTQPPTDTGTHSRGVAVVGAGVAGLAAAAALAEAGLRVTVLERRPVLGGRAASFSGQGLSEPVDNCQHVLLRCCTSLLDFYRRVGVEDRVAFHRRLTFIDGSGRRSVLAPVRLPAPLHLGPAFLRLRFLGLRDKLAVARGLLRMLRQDPDAPELRSMTIGEWLDRARQTPRAREAFWDPVLISALNESPDRAAARYGLRVFREGFLATRDAYEVGIPTVTLAGLYEEPCESFVTKRGGEVRRGTAVTRLLVAGDAVVGIALQSGEEIRADAVVCAAPHDALLKLLPDEVIERHAVFAGLRNLETSPITAVHLWFDRPVTDLEHAVLLDRRLQWMFNKTRNFGLEGKGCYLGVVVSASRCWTGRARGEILEEALKETQEVFPEAASAALTAAKVVVESRATFSPTPDSDRWRPPQRSPLRGLYLAGDWTNTGWPGTMEGAVRSGYQAAEALLEDLGTPQRFVAPDLQPTGLSALLMRR